jgi:hypothetical protein
MKRFLEQRNDGQVFTAKVADMPFRAAWLVKFPFTF